MHIVSIDVDGTPEAFELDLGHGTWHSDAESVDEAEYPLVTVLDGKRYELYSDGTFSEQELT
jgi:hypothetical protein